MDRPIVINSLICFIHNFRSHPHLEVLTRSYFSKSVNEVARQTLLNILAEAADGDILPSSYQTITIVELFDKVAILNPAPVFVAADLTTLPMVLIGDRNQSKNVVDEIHQLRWFIQSIFTGNQYKKLPSCYLSALNNSDASTEKEVASARASPINLSTRRSTSPRFSEPQEQEQQHSNNESIDIEGMDTMSQPSSPPLSSTNVTPTKKSSSLSPRKHAPYRLDKAVRKLTDRLEASKDGVCSRRSSPLQQPKSEYLNTTEFIGETSNNVSTENEKPVNGTVSTPSTMPFLSQPNLNGAVDPFAFIMLRNLANASKQSSKNSAIKSPQKDVTDMISVDAGSVDEMDDEEKMSNESSPTPSDSSNGKEYKNDYEKNDGEKPFTCGQPNCSKRFANKFLLKKHQFIHTGLRPHICPYCAKRFNRKDNLLRHKKTHLANAALQLDGRRRHHALLAPATLTSGTFDPLTLLQISQTQNNNPASGGVNFKAISS